MRRTWRRRAVLASAGLVAGVIALVFASHRTPAAPAEDTATASALPDPVAPAFTVPTPLPLRNPRLHYRYAAVARPVAARRAPGAAGPVVGRLATITPEGTTNIVLVLGRAREAGGRLWVRVRLPVLPNNTTGWVPRASLGGYEEIHTRLVVDSERFIATLLRNGRPIFRAHVGVGEPAWPTPTGEFYVRNKLTDFDNAFYGPVAFGTSARSAVLTDWPAGGFVGIHGTNQPELLPGRVSHGCIRMRNEDILELARLMPVGTRLTIR
jgi:lipoprotein-anchoring transpeptidase ErfK/SrfK